MTAARVLARARRYPFASRMAALPGRFRPGAIPASPIRVHLATTGPEPGNWLIAVDGPRCSVLDGSVPEPDARVYTDSEIGIAVLDGAMTLESAVASRLVDYDGDAGVLRYLVSSLGLEGEG